MRRVYRAAITILFGLTMLTVLLTPPGRWLESHVGLSTLYQIRGPVAVPEEAVIVGLDNNSVRWLSQKSLRLAEASPGLDACLPPEGLVALREAANVNQIPRALHGCLIDRLAALGPSLIAFDINFRIARRGDAFFAEKIRNAGNVYLFERFSKGPLSVERMLPTKPLLDAAAGTMAFNVNSVRGQMATGYLTRHGPFDELRAMPDRIWMAYKGASLAMAEDLIQYFWMYGPPGIIPTIPLRALFDPELAGTLPVDLRDKVVFIGSSDPDDASIDDHFPVPTTGLDRALIGGVELAATGFLNRLHGTMLQRPPIWAEALLVFLFTALGALAALSLAGWRLGIVLCGMAAAWLTLAAITFTQAQLWLPLAVPAFLATILLAIIALMLRYLFARNLALTLAPRQAVSSLMGGTVAARRDVETQRATIMFTDLVGST